MRRSLVVLLVAAVLALVPVRAPAQANVSLDNYVALGDSYTAGPLIPNQIEPYGCLKSDHNYPHLLAPRLQLGLRDMSCSGATTDDMTAAQGVSPGPNPPQFDALDDTTRIVTLGISGNDIGFSEIARNCASLTPTGTPCQDHYVVNGVDELRARIANTAPKVAAVLQGIHSRAPIARVYVVGYLPIFPETGIGCWPTLPIAWNDVPYLRGVENDLNAMLAQVAVDNGAHFVDVHAASIGHDACAPPVIRWVESAVVASPAAPLHPNLFGEQAYAEMTAAVISST